MNDNDYNDGDEFCYHCNQILDNEQLKRENWLWLTVEGVQVIWLQLVLDSPTFWHKDYYSL